MCLWVQGAVLTVIAQQRLMHMLEDVRAGAVSPGQHRGSEQDLKQMAEVAKYVNACSMLLQEPSLTAFPSCESSKVCCGCLRWKQPCCCKLAYVDMHKCLWRRDDASIICCSIVEFCCCLF